jgi:hypothetical protein
VHELGIAEQHWFEQQGTLAETPERSPVIQHSFDPAQQVLKRVDLVRQGFSCKGNYFLLEQDIYDASTKPLNMRMEFTNIEVRASAEASQRFTPKGSYCDL